MKKLSFAALAISALVLVFAACGEKKFRGYKQTKTGLYYKITTKNDKGKMPQQGDYLLLELSFDADFDSTLVFPSQEMPERMRTSLFKGDIYEAYSLLKEGEEGEFYIKADSFFLYVFGGLPPTVKAEDVLHFKIKIKEVKTAAQKAKEEQTALANYLSEQKITVEPTESGLFFVEIEKGKGAKAENGKEVTVHYTGKFLDGKVFDSSLERGEPIEFRLGGAMIPGFTEGILMMNEGGKATLVLPSALAYGDRGYGGIPPCTPLVFEVELVKVSEAKPVEGMSFE